MSDSITVRKSSGNVFADLGIEDPEEYLAKSDLAAQIQIAIEAQGLTQKAAGALLGISQPKVSTLLKGRLDGFSTDRLFRFLTLLGSDIKISVSTPHPESRGHVFVFPAKAPRQAIVHKGRGGMSVSGEAKVSVTRRKAKRSSGSSSPVGATS
jgi:predicted XRE-type DNA-binding protein